MSDVEKDNGDPKDEPKNKNTDGGENKKAPTILTDQSMNFDDILKCDTLPGLLSVSKMFRLHLFMFLY